MELGRESFRTPGHLLPAALRSAGPRLGESAEACLCAYGFMGWIGVVYLVASLQRAGTFAFVFYPSFSSRECHFHLFFHYSSIESDDKQPD
jgi:hypothetical protein